MLNRPIISRRHSAVVGTLAAMLCSLASVASAAPSSPSSTTKPAPSTIGEPAAASGVVNVNTANEAELVRLPGVGPSRAKAILELRTRSKRFEKLEDLMRVKGIGRATFRNLRPMLTLDGPTTLLTKSSTPRTKPAPTQNP
jgi:competence protein ComEA